MLDDLSAVAAIWKQQKRELVARFGGASMQPTIPPDTPLAIACHGEPQPGEVILALHRGQPLVHRLLARSRNGKWLLTRGDANLVPDTPIAADAVIGRILGISRDDVTAPLAPHRERTLQRFARAIVQPLFRVSAAASRPAINLLWAVLWTLVRLDPRQGIDSLLARVWSRTGGALLDVNVMLTIEVRAKEIAFEPRPPFRFARVAVSSGSPYVAQAAALLRIDVAKRAKQELFVALAGERVVACTWSDPPVHGVVGQRGLIVARDHRGQSLGGAMLRFQAAELARDRVERVQYHISITNRPSLRTLRKMGAQMTEAWITVIALRRFGRGIRLSGRAERAIRRRWERA